MICKITLFPEPPKYQGQQYEAAKEDEQANGMALTAQINEREGIIDDMDDNARDNAARTPI